MNTNIGDRTSELKTLDQDIALLGDQADAKSQEITQMKGDLSAALRANSDQNAEIQGLVRKSNEVRLENERTERKVTQVNTQVDEIVRQNNTLEGLIAELDKEIAGLQSDLRNAKLDVQEKTRANEKRSLQLRASQNQADEAEKVADSLDRDIQFLEQDLDKNTSTALSSEKKLESEIFQGQQLESRLTLFEKELDTKFRQVEEMKRELTVSRTRTSELKTDNDELNLDIDECRAHLEDLIELNKRVAFSFENFAHSCTSNLFVLYND